MDPDVYAELLRREVTLHRRILFVAAPLGIAALVLSAFVLPFEEWAEVAYSLLLVPLIATFMAAEAVHRVLLRKRSRVWAEELAARAKLPVSQISEALDMVNAPPANPLLVKDLAKAVVDGGSEQIL